MISNLVKIFICSTLLFSSLALARSEKKLKADRNAIEFKTPQVVEKRDTIFGLRTSFGDLNDGGPGAGLHIERMLSEYFGVTGEAYYSKYSQQVGGLGTFDYTSTILVAYASFHADIFKAKNLDTYISLGVAHSEVSGKISLPPGFPNPGNSQIRDTDLVLFLTGRYFFNSRWAASASLGKNLNTFMIGTDYLF